MKEFKNLKKSLSIPDDIEKLPVENILIAKAKGETYVYIKTQAKYLWVEKKKFFKSPDVCNNLMIDLKELKWLRISEDIKTFDDMVYLYGWKERCFNLLNENDILIPSDTPNIDPRIKQLIESIGAWKKENIDYLHKLILYKYLHINDFSIPAIILYGVGGSWKWTLMSLFKTIYWENNVLANLWQRDLAGGYDTYRGDKIVVEFAEIITNNTHTDKHVLNNLKNKVMADKIMVNEKYIQPYSIDNIALFFITSNSNRPVQLDSKEKGNRRFSVIKSITALSNWKEINEAVKDKKIVSDYLARLHEEYKEVLDYKSFSALDNEDKRDLELLTQDEGNNFWDRVEDSYPLFTGKKTTREVGDLINEYCFENDLNEKDFKKYFWRNSKYPSKKLRIWKKTLSGVIIPEPKGLSLTDIKDVFWN